MSNSNASAAVAAVAADNAAKELKLSKSEIAVLKALAAVKAGNMPFPSFVLIDVVEEGIEAKSMPGLVASLVKKSMVETAKASGVTVVSLTAEGEEFAKLAS